MGLPTFRSSLPIREYKIHMFNFIESEGDGNWYTNKDRQYGNSIRYANFLVEIDMNVVSGSRVKPHSRAAAASDRH